MEKQINYQTPKQITQAHPEIGKEWGVGMIGALFYPLKLVRGIKAPRATLVDADGVLQLFNKRHKENKCR